MWPARTARFVNQGLSPAALQVAASCSDFQANHIHSKTRSLMRLFLLDLAKPRFPQTQLAQTVFGLVQKTHANER